LMSAEARNLRHSTALALCGAISKPWQATVARRVEDGSNPTAVTAALAEAQASTAVGTASDADAARPVSDAAKLLRQRQARWKRKVALLLFTSHLSRQLKKGSEGFRALLSLAYLTLRIAFGAVWQAALRIIGQVAAKGRGDGGAVVATD